MVELKVAQNKLLLPANTKVSIDMVPPLMKEGIEDDWSVPSSIPTTGNEEALGHVHRLSLAERVLVHQDAELRYGGQHLGGGVLHVLGSDDTSVKISFSAQGLANRLKGVRLRTALAGNNIDTVPDGGLIAHAKLVTMRDTPHQSHCFPMHLNPELYGNENPAWQPDHSEWDETKAYVMNDRVTIEEASPVLRQWTYQALGNSTGQRPDVSPGSWRRTVFGLVNSYDVSLERYDINAAGGNYFAMVPWFRYDWVLKTALQAIGITVRGDWFTSPNTPLMLLANSTPLDASEPVGRFGALQTTPLTYPTAIDDRFLPCNTESAHPYDDPSGLWDPEQFLFTPDAAGVWTLTITANATFTTADQLVVSIRLHDGSSVFNPDTGYPWFISSGPDAMSTSISFSVSFYVDLINVGHPVYIRADSWNSGPFVPITLSDCSIMGYRSGGTALNTYRDVIDPAQHVPDMELGVFLQDVADTFGLEVVPHLESHVLEINVKAGVIRNYTNAEDQSGRIAGGIEMDHSRRTTGLRFAWPVESIDPKALLGSTLATVVDREDDLDGVEVASRQHTIIRSTRKVYHSEPQRHGGIDVQAWRLIGYSTPPVVSGDVDTASDMPVGIKPVQMEEQWVDGRKLLMPLLRQAGESAFYATGRKQAELYLCINGLKQEAREDGALYPGSLSWGIDNKGSECESLLLQPQRDIPTGPDYWLRWHQAWVDTLVRSEPVITDLLLDLPFLRGNAWHRIMPMSRQLYLLEKMPLSLGNGSADEMVSKDVYLRRLRPAVQPWPQPLPPVVRRRCVYWVDITAHFSPNIAASGGIQSFEVDGVEHAPGGLSFDGSDSYITVGGEDYYTNLIDTLATLAVPGFTFWPAERILVGGDADYKGQWMAITYPVTSEWSFVVGVGSSLLRYSSAGVEAWMDGAWGPCYNYLGTAPHMRNCEIV